MKTVSLEGNKTWYVDVDGLLALTISTSTGEEIVKFINIKNCSLKITNTPRGYLLKYETKSKKKTST